MAGRPVGGGHRHRLGVGYHGGGVVEPPAELDQRVGVDVALQQWFEGAPVIRSDPRTSAGRPAIQCAGDRQVRGVRLRSG